MGGSVHDAKALAEFQQGETRLVFARRKDEPQGELFYLEDGQAETMRKFTGAHLECFMPECSNRRLTTVARRKGRDGFRHMRGADGHSAESLFHAQAKELIRRWALSKDPLAMVEIEQATGSKSRRADVMIHWSSDSLPATAVEVQYSAMTVKSWQERHESYIAQGIVDLWLFGHVGAHFKAQSECGGLTPAHAEVRLKQVHQAVIEAGVPMIWINPIAALVGVASIPVGVYRCPTPGCVHPFMVQSRFVPPDKDASSAWFSVDSLDDCSPSPLGMTTPKLDQFRAEVQSLAHEAEVHHVEQEKERAKAQERAAEDQRLQVWQDESRERLEAQWRGSKLRRQILEEHGGTFPSELAYRHPSQDAVYALPPYWHSLIYADHVLNKPRGHRFTVGDCYSTLGRYRVQMHDDKNRRSAAVIGFLKHLEWQGVLSLRRKNEWVEGITVHLTIKDKMAEHAQAERQRELEAEARAAEEARRRETQNARNRDRLDLLPERQERHRCIRCGIKLDPILAKRGYHIGCD